MRYMLLFGYDYHQFHNTAWQIEIVIDSRMSQFSENLRNHLFPLFIPIGTQNDQDL
jgi:hypothetical protein